MARGDLFALRRIKTVVPEEFSERKFIGRKSKLKPWQVSYAKHARQLRRALARRIKNDLTDYALAEKFGVCPATVSHALDDKYTAYYDFIRETA